MEKNRLLISFSGGRTSAYMTKLLLDHVDRNLTEVVVVFANTGKESKETYDFIRQCDKKFGFGTIWVESVINPLRGKGTRAKVVDYHTADRTGRVFENMIRKYGIPNIAFKHCTRELKIKPIRSYAIHQLGWKNFYTAIGIRTDEAARMSSSREKMKIIYPLISMYPSDRYDVNKFWMNQSFDLQLKSYEGNCDFCLEKSDRKLITLCKETPDHTNWWKEIEDKYSDFIPEGRTCNKVPVRFYRRNRSIRDFIELSEHEFIPARDESKDLMQMG